MDEFGGSLKGVMPRAFEQIFDHININKMNKKYVVKASVMEVCHSLLIYSHSLNIIKKGCTYLTLQIYILHVCETKTTPSSVF
jgi:hypothetical protein